MMIERRARERTGPTPSALVVLGLPGIALDTVTSWLAASGWNSINAQDADAAEEAVAADSPMLSGPKLADALPSLLPALRAHGLAPRVMILCPSAYVAPPPTESTGPGSEISEALRTILAFLKAERDSRGLRRVILEPESFRDAPTELNQLLSHGLKLRLPQPSGSSWATLPYVPADDTLPFQEAFDEVADILRAWVRDGEDPEDYEILDELSADLEAIAGVLDQLDDELERAFGEDRSRRKSAEAEVERLSQEIVSADIELERINKELSETRAGSDRAKAEAEQRRSELAQRNAERDDLSEMAAALRRQNEALSAALDELRERANMYEAEALQSREKLALIERQSAEKLAEGIARATAATRRLPALEAELAHSRDTEAALRTQLFDADASHSRALRTLETRLTEQKNAESERVAELEKWIEELYASRSWKLTAPVRAISSIMATRRK